MGKERKNELPSFLKAVRFYWENIDSSLAKLVFLNEKGDRFEQRVKRESLERALQLFDGKPHLVKRTSGGYSPALASQLFVSPSAFPLTHSEKGEKATAEQIKIRARFIDFERDSQGRILSNKTLVYHKNIPLSAFSSQPQSVPDPTRSFALDIGEQQIPIVAFDFFLNSEGDVMALFVTKTDLERAASQPRGQKESVKIFCAPEAVLRVNVEPASLKNNSLAGTAELPSVLQWGKPKLIPTGCSLVLLSHYLKVCCDSQSSTIQQTFLSVLEKPQPGEPTQLMPFGVFE